MRLLVYLFAFLVSALLSGCSNASVDDLASFDVFSANYDFSISSYGWEGDFADYVAKDSSKMGLKFEYSELPPTSQNDLNKKFLTLKGKNTNSSLFFFIKKKVTDLRPDTEYTLVFEVQLIFGLDSGLVDSGYLKVGATAEEPTKIVDADYCRINIDKGSNGNSGIDMLVIGKAASTTSYEVQDFSINQNTPGYNTNPPLRVKTNKSGELWLIIGMDSMVKGKQAIYFKSANVVYSVSH